MTGIGKLGRRIGVAALLAMASTAMSQADTLRSETSAVAGGNYLINVAMASVVAENTKHKIEINAGNNGVQSMLRLARGEIDIANVILAHYVQMKERTGNYKKFEDAPALANNLRAMFAYPAGTYQGVVWESSGIKSLNELKGKRLYLGPKKSAAEYYGLVIVEGETGFKAGKDFQLVDLDFKGGEQAFLDGHVDFYMRTAPKGSAIIEQLGVTHPIRLLGFTKARLDNPQIAEAVNEPGRSVDVIPPKTYTGQANKDDVLSMGFWLGMGIRKDLDEQTVYDLTKAFWEHLERIKASNKALFASLNIEDSLKQLNVPLHPGAYRYYKEIGVDVPERIMPPTEAN